MPTLNFADLLRALKEEHQRQELLISKLSRENQDLKALNGSVSDVTDKSDTPSAPPRLGLARRPSDDSNPLTPTNTTFSVNNFRSNSRTSALSATTRALEEFKSHMLEVNQFTDVNDPELAAEAAAIITHSKCSPAARNNLDSLRRGSLASVVSTFYASLRDKEEGSWLRLKILEFMTKDAKFESFVGLIIVANSAMIGLESSLQVRGQSTAWIYYLELVFLLIYCVELCLRIYVYRVRVFRSYWVRFDALLVVSGISAAISEAFHSDTVIQQVMILRVLRVFRLARALRLLVQFRTLWQLVGGLLTSCQTIVYSFLLLVVLLYVFACVALETITMHPLAKPDTAEPEFRRIVQDNFSDLHVCMLTLVQFLNLDSIAQIYEPLVRRDPRLILYFMAFFMFVPVTMMNLITAVIVESSRDQVEADKEMQRKHQQSKVKKIVPFLGDLFRSLDMDGSGLLSKDEVQDASEELKAQLKDWLNVDDIHEIFDIIDADGSGVVTVEEFCDEISRHFCSGKPLEFTRIMKHLKLLRNDYTADMAKLRLANEHLWKQVDKSACASTASNGSTVVPREHDNLPRLSVKTTNHAIDL